MKIGIGLGLSQRRGGGGGGFSPFVMAENATNGFFIDFSDESALYTDTSRSTPIAESGLIAGATDLLGFGNHGAQAASGNRLIYSATPEGRFGAYSPGSDGVKRALVLSAPVCNTNKTLTLVGCGRLETPEFGSQEASILYYEPSGGLSLFDVRCSNMGAELASLRLGARGSTGSTIRNAVGRDVLQDSCNRVFAVRIKPSGADYLIEMWIDGNKQPNSITMPAATVNMVTTAGAIGNLPSLAGNAVWGWIFGITAVNVALSDDEVVLSSQWFAKRYVPKSRTSKGAYGIAQTYGPAVQSGKPLLAWVNSKCTVGVADMSMTGPFQGISHPLVDYPVPGDNHFGPSLLPLSDGRVLAGWPNRSGTSPSALTSVIAADLKSHSTILDHGVSIGLKEIVYNSFAEIDDHVYMFMRGVDRDGPDASQSGWTAKRYFSKLPLPFNDASLFPEATAIFASPVEEINYMTFAKNGSDKIEMFISDKNPRQGDPNLYHLTMTVTGGVESLTDIEGNSVAMGVTLSSLTPIYNSATEGLRAWIRSITVDDAGFPRMTMTVFDTIDVVGGTSTQSYWLIKWNGTAWVKSMICTSSKSSLVNDSIGVGGHKFDPDDCNVVYASRSVSDGDHQIWRYASSDDGATWSGYQITNKSDPCVDPVLYPSTVPEPRLLFNSGNYESYSSLDLTPQLTNSLTPATP